MTLDPEGLMDASDEALAVKLQQQYDTEAKDAEQKVLELAKADQQLAQALHDKEELPHQTHFAEDWAIAQKLQQTLEDADAKRRQEELAANEAAARALVSAWDSEDRKRSRIEGADSRFAQSLAAGTASRARGLPQRFEANFDPTYPKMGKRSRPPPRQRAPPSANDCSGLSSAAALAAHQLSAPEAQPSASASHQQLHAPHSRRTPSPEPVWSAPPFAHMHTADPCAGPLALRSEDIQAPQPGSSAPQQSLSYLQLSAHRQGLSLSRTPDTGSQEPRAPRRQRSRWLSRHSSDSEAEDPDFLPGDELTALQSDSSEDEAAGTNAAEEEDIGAEAAELAQNFEPDLQCLQDDEGDLVPGGTVPATPPRGFGSGEDEGARGSEEEAGRPRHKHRRRGPKKMRGGRGASSRVGGAAAAFSQEGLDQLRQKPEWQLSCPFVIDGSELNQHAPRHAGPPWMVYEQVMVMTMSGLDELCKIPRDLDESPCIAMDAFPHFSSNHRVRLYLTNLRNHCSASIWVQKHKLRVPGLLEIIGWQEGEPVPAWFAPLLEAPAATINTMAYPDKIFLNACSEAIKKLGSSSQLPKVVTVGRRDIEVAKKVKQYCLVPRSQQDGGGCRGLTPRECEHILGFRGGHTSKHGDARNSDSERRKMLGNSFQVDKIAYLLHPLKDMQDRGELPPEGIVVMSLFDGIGGALVALYKLGVRMRKYITSEKSAACEAVVKQFIQKHAEVTQGLPLHEFYQPLGDILPRASERPRSGKEPPISEAFVRKLVAEHGCHLIIGGSPCNNLTGNNRQPSTSVAGRSGFAGQDSRLFCEFEKAVRKVREAYREQRAGPAAA